MALATSVALESTGLAQTTETPQAPLLRINTGAHTAPVRALDVDLAGRYAATASEDKTARVWDLATGRLLQTLRPPVGADNDGKLFAVAITPDGAVVAAGGWSADNDVYLFDRTSGAMVQRITGLPDVVTQLAFAPDGRTLVIGLWGKNGLRVFRSDSDWRTAREAGSDARFDGDVNGVQFNANGRRLAATSSDGFVRVYDLESQPLKLLQSARTTGGHQPFGIAWSPDASLLAVAFADTSAVSVLQAESLQPAFAPDTTGIAGGSLNAVAWSADGNELFAAGTWKRPDQSHGLRRWAKGGRGAASDLSLTSNSVTALHTLADGRVLYTAADPAWGWVTPSLTPSRTGSGRTSQASLMANFEAGSRLVDFRGDRSAFRVARDGSAIAFPMRNGAEATPNSGLASGFNLAQAEWTAPKPQWVAASAAVSNGGNSVQISEWFESQQPRLNGRPLALTENEVSLSAAVAASNAGFAPGNIALVLGTSFYVRGYKADGAELWRTPAPGTTWHVNVSGDGRWVIAGFSDGTLRWYRAKDGTEQLALYPHPDKRRWVLWTPSGYYAAAPGGEDLIGWNLNRGKDKTADFFPASRFRTQFYRPDVVAKVIETGNEADALRLANLDASRSPPAAALLQALPPVVEIVTPRDGLTSAAGETTVRIALRTATDAPVIATRVRVNGLLQPEARSLLLIAAASPDILRNPTARTTPPDASPSLTRDLVVKLPAEDAEIQVFAENRNGVSLPATLRVKRPKSTPVVAPAVASIDDLLKPKLYVLAVGLSKYATAEYNLDYAAKDARDFAAVLQQQKGTLYRDVEVKILTDEKATKDDVLDGLEWLKREVTSRDVSILFLAGHGINDNAGNYYFLPHNVNPKQLLRTGVAHNDIKLTLNSIAGKALFFIDTCHSGNALGTSKTRGVVDVNAVVNDLASAENGVVVFAASTGRQSSQESPEWGNGAFTKALVEGLTGRADFRKTGTITHKGLDFYVAERVKELTKGEQSPVSIAPQGVSDFPIAVVNR